ncbi:MAG: Dabb family protein [Asticcacaulis sp.]
MIRHIVPFRLKHAAGSAEEADFLSALARLAAIPGVQAFEVLPQIGRKNSFSHAVSMAFADDAAYQAYNAHPDHVAFVEGRWIPEVAEFAEIDLLAE